MTVDFKDKRFRPTFEAEQKRILTAIRDCEVLDEDLNETYTTMKTNSARVRGAFGLMARLSEQIIANRNHRLALIKELRVTKRDVAEREISLAVKEAELGAGSGQSGVSAALLKHLQALILVPGSIASFMEPAVPHEPPPEPPGEPEPADFEIPTEIRVGDVVSDPEGELWIVTEEGAERINLRAAATVADPEDGSPPHAILEDGRYVLMADIGS